MEPIVGGDQPVVTSVISRKKRFSGIAGPTARAKIILH
jgi:hypothetical protein